MPSSAAIRTQIEAALARKIPSALTPAPRVIRPVVSTGIVSLDDVLQGGLPVGAISEFVGPECSGRTTAALSFLAQVTQAGKVCAWIDIGNAFDPASAAAAGVDLARMLWVRCSASKFIEQQARTHFSLPEKYLDPAPVKKGLHGGGCGGHPRGEVKGLADAVGALLGPETFAPRCAEPQQRARPTTHRYEPMKQAAMTQRWQHAQPTKPWPQIEKALRAIDLLLQGGGFSAIVLDFGSIAPEFSSRVPLATWFRYRAAAERTQASILLLAQYACAKSSAELTLRLQPGSACCDEPTVFTGMHFSAEVVRRRFTGTASTVVPLRKPPQNVNAAAWQSRAAWAGCR